LRGFDTVCESMQTPAKASGLYLSYIYLSIYLSIYVYLYLHTYISLYPRINLLLIPVGFGFQST
jgi:hypothetical protein